MSDGKCYAKEFCEFLWARPAVVSVLTDCWEPIQRIFGEKTPITMQLGDDFEGGQHIFCGIEWSDDWREGSKRLRKFDEEFWLARCGEVTTDVVFDIRLV